MTDFENLTLIIQTLSFAVLTVTALILARSIVVDHDRRKKQATLARANELRELVASARMLIEIQFGEDPITMAHIEAIKADKKIASTIRTMLGHYEEVALGSNNGVYDKELLNNMCGGQFIRIYTQFKNYILNARARSTAPEEYKPYGQLKELVLFFEQKRHVPNSKLGAVKSY